jgi:hypothetical protein
LGAGRGREAVAYSNQVAQSERCGRSIRTVMRVLRKAPNDAQIAQYFKMGLVGRLSGRQSPPQFAQPDQASECDAKGGLILCRLTTYKVQGCQFR